MLFWVGIVRRSLSANQIVRCSLSANQIVQCFKLKKLENSMTYQVDVLLPLKLQKYHAILGYDPKILLANQFAGFFTFDLFDFSVLIPGVHCYIVLAFNTDYQLESPF